MFLLDNRLVVYTRSASSGTTGSAGSSNPSDQGCTYGYDCRFTSEGGRTQILVFDVTTPRRPTELVRYEMSGGYVASRRIGSYVYTVVHDTGATEVAGLDLHLVRPRATRTCRPSTRRFSPTTTRRSTPARDDFFLPWITMTKPGGTATSVAPCQ